MRKENWMKRKLNLILLILSILGIGLLCIVVLTFFTTSVIQPLLIPKDTYILYPMMSESSPPLSMNELRMAAHILKQRWNSISGNPLLTSFKVSNMGVIIAQFPSDTDPDMILWTTDMGLVEFVDLGDRPLNEWTYINTDYRIGDQLETGKHWHTILTWMDFEQIYPVKNKFGSIDVKYEFTEAGKNILNEYRKNNKGNYIGIVIDKQILDSRTIEEIETNGSGIWSWRLSSEFDRLFIYDVRYGPLPYSFSISPDPGAESLIDSH